MTTALQQLNQMIGAYVGEGINHEGQPFTGRLELVALFEGRGFQLKFSATGRDGTVYHKEESTVAPSLQKTLTLWNFNTNTPGLVPHELRTENAKSGSLASLVFGFGRPDDKATFREEVALDIWDPSTLSYTYSWGLPGGDFHERSGARMTKLQPSQENVKAVEQPRLETDRLILAAYRDSDLPDIFAYASHPEVARLLTWQTHRTLDDSKNFLKWVYSSTRTGQGNLFFVFAIRLKETGRVIGSIDFKNPQPWVGQVDYALGRDHWGKGLMPEAAEALKNWAFEAFPEIVRFQAYCEVENKASARVMEKIGMKFEGVRRKSFRVQKRIVDLAHYASLREDFQ